MLKQGKEARWAKSENTLQKGEKMGNVGGTTPWPDCIFLTPYLDLTLISGPTKMEWLLYGHLSAASQCVTQSKPPFSAFHY